MKPFRKGFCPTLVRGKVKIMMASLFSHLSRAVDPRAGRTSERPVLVRFLLSCLGFSVYVVVVATIRGPYRDPVGVYTFLIVGVSMVNAIVFWLRGDFRGGGKPRH